jgi:undecaprenyl-diphosphatase
MRRLLEIAALGAIQGAAELLPVSSSAHVAVASRLLGWDEPARRKELEVALHAGAAVALAPEFLQLLPDAGTLLRSLLPPVVVGYAFEERIERLDPVVGLLLGACALALADRDRPARELGWWLGAAQAAALVPGVSRTGATLAAARWLGRSRAEASRLSFGVAGPVLVGATALKAWRARRGTDSSLLVGAVAAFVSARVALRVVGVERAEAWWPYALERVVLAAFTATCPGVALPRRGTPA